MKPRSVAIVGAAETTELGRIPDLSQLQLHADAALNTMADAGLKPSDNVGDRELVLCGCRSRRRLSSWRPAAGPQN